MSKQEKKPIEVTLDVLQALVNEGKTKSEIGTHFNLSPVQTARLLKEANLKPKRAVVPAFVLIKTGNEVSSTPATEAREVSKTETKKEKASKEKVTSVDSKPVENDPDLLQITNKVDNTEEKETKEQSVTEND